MLMRKEGQAGLAKQYEAVIGLEVHVELATRTKIFCGCAAVFGGEPNEYTCPVCTGMPGSLPVLNKKVVEYAAAVGLAVNCCITKDSKFDRKNYFYPDNPQNYQISQLYSPIARNGYIEITGDDGNKRIRIHEIHMEEDAGKLTHDEWEGDTLVDYNRSGIPLIEIVSAPDLRSAGEAAAYLEELRTIIQYLGVSDCKLQEGSMRVDVNLSVRETGTRGLGVRTEMKNLNSFKAISRAIDAEKERQVDLLENGGSVRQETRRWDDEKGRSYTMRSKEDAQDYRYFPDPDIPPLHISDDWIQHIAEKQPELHYQKMKRYKSDYQLPEYDIKLLTANRRIAELFEETAAICKRPKQVSNWLMGETMRVLNEKGMDENQLRFSSDNLAKLIKLTDERLINRATAKDVFSKIFEDDIDPVEYVKDHKMIMNDNEDELKQTVLEVLNTNPKAAAEYRCGKTKVLGFLIGHAMKKLNGRGDPNILAEIFKKMINLH